MVPMKDRQSSPEETRRHNRLALPTNNAIAQSRLALNCAQYQTLPRPRSARRAARQRMGTTQMMLGIKLIELHLEHGIGLRIAARRHQLHWSQGKLARAIGCSRQTITAYESGECSIPAARLS